MLEAPKSRTFSDVTLTKICTRARGLGQDRTVIKMHRKCLNAFNYQGFNQNDFDRLFWVCWTTKTYGTFVLPDSRSSLTWFIRKFWFLKSLKVRGFRNCSRKHWTNIAATFQWKIWFHAIRSWWVSQKIGLIFCRFRLIIQNLFWPYC